jgi:alkaline phosphatase D
MAFDISRRAIIGGGLCLTGAALAAPGELRAMWRAGYPFTLGVASGEPSPDGMVLWTRLAPTPLAADGGMPSRRVPVRWEISATADFAKPLRGTAYADPAWGHSVHVEVRGLAPGRAYWYRFIAGGEVSPVGRTRTAPAPGQAVDKLRLCFGSCQKYEVGHYAAWRHAVADDPDLILFLGDYIYEGNPSDSGVRRHQNPEPKDVGGYRVRYATYRSDPLLQAAHAAAPWVVTWDDHEVANNYGGGEDEQNSDPVAFLLRRAAAYQVYWEHMPLRFGARPKGPNAALYRTIGWGDLAAFQVIDDRQYRDPPPCQAPDAIAKHIPTIDKVLDCAERNLASRTMLGGAQEAWLNRALDTSHAQWNLLAQQTLMMPLAMADAQHPEQGPMWNTDRWDGYPATRARILRRLRDAKTANPLILSGDIHSFVAGDHADPDDPRRLVASEFVGGSITSLNHSPYPDHPTEENPGFRFSNIEKRGYGRVELHRDRCDVTFRGVVDARDPQSAAIDLAHFTVESGRVGMQKG